MGWLRLVKHINDRYLLVVQGVESSDANKGWYFTVYVLFSLQQIEHLLTQFGPVLKMEIEESRIFNIVYCRSPSFITFNIQIIVITGGCCLLLSSRLKGLRHAFFLLFSQVTLAWRRLSPLSSVRRVRKGHWSQSVLVSLCVFVCVGCGLWYPLKFSSFTNSASILRILFKVHHYF